MRCPRCGNENPGTNRFCGMCGATLLPTPAVSTPQNAAAEVPTAVSPLPPRPAPAPPAPGPRSTSEPRAAAAPPDREPVISGPSFLGLNQPADNQSASRESRRAPLSIDPKAAPSSRNLDYLLQDDEPKSGGAGKFILIVVALLLAVGLGYLRWKNQGLGWLGKSASKPPAATDAAGTADSDGSPSSTANSNSASPSSSNSAPAGANPAVPGPATATPSPSAPSTAPPVTSDQPVTNQPAPSDSGSAATPPAGNDAKSSPPSATQGATTDDPNLATPSAPNHAKDPNSTADTESAPIAKPKPAPKPVKVDPITEAQKYLYGKGVKQDCDRGMRLLKPEADRSNPKAMTQMGALYSAGLCTPHDLPTAYRWFALALRKDPDNQELQGDLQKLWGEMTQPERQQAIRLSQ